MCMSAKARLHQDFIKKSSAVCLAGGWPHQPVRLGSAVRPQHRAAGLHAADAPGGRHSGAAWPSRMLQARVHTHESVRPTIHVTHPPVLARLRACCVWAGDWRWPWLPHAVTPQQRVPPATTSSGRPAQAKTQISRGSNLSQVLRRLVPGWSIWRPRSRTADAAKAHRPQCGPQKSLGMTAIGWLPLGGAGARKGARPRALSVRALQGRLEAGLLYTSSYLRNIKVMLRGALRGVSEPTTMASVVKVGGAACAHFRWCFQSPAHACAYRHAIACPCREGRKGAHAGTCMHTHTYTHRWRTFTAHTGTCTCKHTYARTDVHTGAAHAHTRTHTHAHTHIHTHTHTQRAGTVGSTASTCSRA